MKRFRSPSTALARGVALFILPVVGLTQIQPARAIAVVASESRESPLAIALRAAKVFEEPLVETHTTTPDEDQALAEAIAAYGQQAAPDDLRVVEEFLGRYPQSGWRVALLANLGLAYYHYGYFSKAIDSWERAWTAGRGATAGDARALVDRAVGELARMHARLGHADRLTALFAEIGDRPVSGAATEAITGAREGLWMMRHNPGVAYLCGPLALRSLMALENKADLGRVKALDEFRSSPQGVSLAELDRLATKARLPHSLAFRSDNQPVPVPAIVHWKVSHFAVVVGETGGRFHIQDPTFGTDLWITRSALDSESSGYFLIPSGTLSAGLREVALAEASQVRGMGYTTAIDPNATRPTDDTALAVPVPSYCRYAAVGRPIPGCPPVFGPEPPQPPSLLQGKVRSTLKELPEMPFRIKIPTHAIGVRGMPEYDIHEPVVSVTLNDTPVGYAPPKGPPVYVTLTYNQREAGQPANFTFFNVSPKWTLNWLSYIQDDPTLPGANVSRYVAGGGSVNYQGYDSSTRRFRRETDTRVDAVLRLPSDNPVRYVRGSLGETLEVYSQSDGATAFPRRVFLTQIIDPAGNSVTLNYDNQLRLASITDATGRQTTFGYEAASRPLLITRITDPFGRSAHIAYDAAGRLSQITDVLGLTSSFAYDAASLVTAMTTPYGTTTFAFGSGLSNGPTRFVEVTDPLGNSERVEYLQGAPGVPDSDSPIPNGINVFYFQDQMFMSGRNTFYWDKLALSRARGDYTRARIRHWLHDVNDPTGTTTSSVIESTKYPLENRIWRNYPSQSSPGFTGNLDRPSAIGRVLDDGSTQLTQITYNGRNMPTRVVDPVGRVSLYDYDSSNLVDLVSVKQEIQPSVPATIAQFTYNAAHRPLTYTDASGQTTTYAYNDAGQITQATDPLGHVSSYEYDHLGDLIRIVNANDQTGASFTYDDFGRVATRTDSEGHTLAFTYDALDRLTQVIYPDGTFYEYTWDRLDLAAVKDRLGRVTQYAHDSVRNLTAVTDALTNTTHVGYYGNGQLKTLTDAKGNTTSWDRDLQGRVTAKRFADGRAIAYGYELTTSRLKSVTDPLGQVKAYGYTVDDRPASIAYANAVNPTPGVAFVYDPVFPRVASMTDGSGETRYLYQDIGAPGALELSQEDGPFSHDRVGYRYDSLGRLATRTVDTSTEQFAYDALGRLVGHATDLGAFEFAYLGQSSQRTQQLLAGSATGTSWAYGTNANDRRLTRIRNSGARTFQYATTPEDLVTGITEMASADRPRLTRAWTYGYDAVDRLLTARPSNGAEYSYSYDPADNITAFPGQDEEEDPGDCGPGPQAAIYNSVNQLTDVGTRTLPYDANGNLTGDGARNYRWDADNRLVGITYKKQQGRRTTLRYDGLGRLVALVSRTGAGSDEVRLLWCGDVICQARTAGDVVTRRYYPEGEAWVGVGRQLYYARDHVGSVRDAIEVGSGQRVASVDYDPYGNALNGGGKDGADFGFAGMLYHRDSGLYLTRNRAYDPRTARWLSRNPLEEAGGVNLYVFAFDNPLRPLGPIRVDSGSPPGSLNTSTPDSAGQGRAR